MRASVRAIYEGGMLKLLTPLSLPEGSVVRVHVEPLSPQAGRVEFLAQGERKLREVWDNEADDAYNALLED